MNIDLEVFNSVGNKLTDIDADGKVYKRVNPHLWASYYGLPRSLGKLASILLALILKTKFYGSKAKEKDIDEDKRIYNDISLTIEDILNEWEHGKYLNGQDMSTDISNMNKRIRDLDDNNIFYCWRYKNIYVFVMERDFRTWKVYNSKGCLVPKTLRKVATVGNDMISCMNKNVRKMYHDVDKSDVEKSFGNFLNRLIDKMNPFVATEIVKWNAEQDVQEYISGLLENIKDIENYEGLTIADDIFDKLPFSLSKKLQEDIKEAMTMKAQQKSKDIRTDMEKEIIPDNPNLVKSHGNQKAKPSHDTPNSGKVQVYSFDGIVDPFKNVPHFMEYYRAFLSQQTHSKIKFDTYPSDSVYAAQILDLLSDNQRSNKTFLNAWLRYFCEQRLKGNKMFKTKYTSLKTFKETFEEYNCRHMEV